MKRLIAVILLALTASAGIAQSSTQLKVAFYNVENLCDTIDSPLINDEAFTPQGSNRWNTVKYHTRIKNIARVIDHINADVIGLSEIENEDVVRDLILALKNDYNYVHRNTSDARGMDMVLLYRATSFYPERIWQINGYGLSRSPLVIEGKTGNEDITFMVCHMPSRINRTQFRVAAANSLRARMEDMIKQNPDINLILMGDFNATPNSQIIKNIITPEILFNPFTKPDRQGYGTYTYRDRRYIFDHIMLSSNILTNSKLRYNGQYGIFAQGYMLQNQTQATGYMKRGRDPKTGVSGFSDHLPVFLTIEIQE